MPLDKDFINSLLADTRGKYKMKLQEFIASDEPVVNPREAWPTMFGEANSSAMYQSFNLAIKSLNGDAGNIVLKQRDGELYILHTGRAALFVAEGDDDETEATDTTDEVLEDSDVEITV